MIELTFSAVLSDRLTAVHNLLYDDHPLRESPFLVAAASEVSYVALHVFDQFVRPGYTASNGGVTRQGKYRSHP
jgi:hypothetical protein